MVTQVKFKWSHRPGTYVLLMTLGVPICLRVGRLGVFPLSPGWYAYVGSALGPGGLHARLSRHTRSTKKLHWHIDYLLGQANLRELWSVEEPERRECVWASLLEDLPGAGVPVPGFGASDCQCRSHLFALTSRPSLAAVSRRGGAVSHETIRQVMLDAEQPTLSHT